jgi:hypothetical protein
MKDSNGSAFALLVVIIILLIILFSMVQGIFGVDAKSYSDLVFPTVAPMETCFNGGLTFADGCKCVFLPVIGR